jgi:hypothetical protein
MIKLIPYILIMILVAIVLGCTKRDVQTSIRLSRLSVTAAGLVKGWNQDRQILVKYKDMLPVDSADRQVLDDIIDGGDVVQKELSLLVVGGTVPSVARLKLIFNETDKLIIAGTILYKKHPESIDFTDKMRAQDFGNDWAIIKCDMVALNDDSNTSDRYKFAKEILSFALEVTGQVVIPALRASGKI